MIPAEDLVTHMRRVQAAERDLRDLFVVWQMIESSAAISCPEAVAPILPALLRTRERFNSLRGRVIDLMASENLGALADELAAKAQCTIDVLVRNLFERTADVGFLATDDEVRAFCAAPSRSDADRQAMVRRLAEYQSKYTVYDDVILLAPDGRVLARLDERSSLEASSDPLVADAMGRDGYVERFGPSDLGAANGPSLLYAQRITRGPAGRDRPIGVLVLRFRFADEMERIFSSMNEDNPRLALVLIDDAQRVVATNDAAHVPCGAKLAPQEGNGIELCSYAGGEYLSVCRASGGYQGYRGPSWRAQAMVSLLNGFKSTAVRTDDDADVAAPLDNAALATMIADAEVISRELRRVMWNGRLMAGEHGGDRMRLKAVLKQVNEAGQHTRERARLGLDDIHRTAVARARRQTRELARLAGDIMDRNLYERANDVRWWALSPVLREALSGPSDPQADARLAQVLDYINGLYTVYTRLVAFDARGTVRAVSNAGSPTDGGGLHGTSVPDSWLSSVSSLRDSLQYAVTPFEDTAMHGAGPTYVYLAAVRSAGGVPAGGIAVVFNAATEFPAMLRDIMAGLQGAAAFMGARGEMIASTDAALARSLADGFRGRSGFVEHEGIHYACTRVKAPGYREFKGSDRYDNGVEVVVGVRLGTASDCRASEEAVELQPVAFALGTPTIEVAVFDVGGMLYALPAYEVIDAIPTRGLARTPGASGAALGLVEVGAGRESGSDARVVPVICARRLFGMADRAEGTDSLLIVLRSTVRKELPAFALRVDDVTTVLDVAHDHVHPTPEGMGTFAPWVVSVIDAQQATRLGNTPALVQLLDCAKLMSAICSGDTRVEARGGAASPVDDAASTAGATA
ncbi:MAG: chemotaxis protein CheW [bacterium]|jgi:chemotaxis signal transduction protein|nr:chemotaxis protein CheW [Betaproteobacteria bacterium]